MTHYSATYRGMRMRLFRMRYLFLTFFAVLFGVMAHAQGDWPRLSVEEWQSMDVATLQSLLEEHHVDERDNTDKTALMYAAHHTRASEVHEFLLVQGADVNAFDRLGNSVLFWAILNPDIEVVKFFIDKEVDVTHRDVFGRQAHMIAAAYGASPLHFDALLGAGLRISEVDFEGRTSLMHAVGTNSDIRMTQTLLRYGANIHAVDKDGNSVLFYAARSSQNPEIIRLLIEDTGLLNKKNKDGKTALHTAAAVNTTPSVVQELISLGAYLNEKDNEGRTPLMMAAGYNSNADIVFTLLRFGANSALLSKGGKAAWNFLQRNQELRNSEYYVQLRKALVQ